MKFSKTKAASLAGLLAAGALSTAVLAPAANAAVTHYVVTEVFWGGQSCINIWNGLYGTLNTRCGGSAVFDEYRTSGAIGLDPEMSGADWIGCNIRVDGVVIHSDSTTRGSGHEVTCIYTL